MSRQLLDPEVFTANDWETPDEVARFIGSLIVSTDRTFLEPAAGRGNLLKYLPADCPTLAYEIKAARVADGIREYPWALWANGDFLAESQYACRHVVISNPPFDLGVEFLRKSLDALDPTYRSARCLFVLPVDYWQSQKRCDALAAMDCHIHRVYALRGRVAYIREGIPERNRQCYDAVFDIRPGRKVGGMQMIDLREDRL